LILTASAVGLVKLEHVREVLFDFVKGKSLDVLEHVCGGSAPLPLVCIESLVDELGDQNCILHIVLLGVIHETSYNVAIVGEDVGKLVGRIISVFNQTTGVTDGESIGNSKLKLQGGSSQGQILGKLLSCSAIALCKGCHLLGNILIGTGSSHSREHCVELGYISRHS
jgi:hypothetical protein